MDQIAAIDLPPASRFGVRRRRWTPMQLVELGRRQPLGLLGMVIIAIFMVVAITAPVIAPVSFASSEFAVLTGPSWDHPFGTDRIGRDIFSRVIYGAQTSMLVGLGSVALATLAGTLSGLVSGYAGGWVDSLIQRLVDVVMAFPFLVLALFIGAVIGRDTQSLVLVLGIAMTPPIVRVVRASVLVEREKDYILAAQSMGASLPRVMFRHVLPNIVAPIIILATTLLAAAILAEAALSFLGFGVPPPRPSWGGDLSGQARAYFEVAPWLAIFPGLALSFVVLGFNFLGDALRDMLDPRLRGTGSGGDLA